MFAVSITAADSGREISFEFLHNQIVVEGTLNGRGPYSFILDTGTRATTVDLRVAKELHLALGSPAPSEGVGTGRPAERRTTAVEVRVGDVTRRLDAAV